MTELPAPSASDDSESFPGLRGVFIERLHGALYLAPLTSWAACSAWEGMLELVREWSQKPTMDSGRRVICVREVCGLPRHAQHALRTVVERGLASSLFVMTAQSQSCIDPALKSRVLLLRPPQYSVGAARPLGATGRGGQSLAALGAVEGSIEDRARIASELADTDHKLGVLERSGAIVGAAVCAVADRAWSKVLRSSSTFYPAA